jgi:hypothetical protein
MILIFILNISIASAKTCYITVASHYHSDRIEKDIIKSPATSKSECLKAAEPYKKNHFTDLIKKQEVTVKWE